jgi:ketosteroid isomerase-like protein
MHTHFRRYSISAAHMSLVLSSGLLLAAGCAISPPPETTAEAASPAGVRQELEQAYELNRRALLARDLNAVLALRTPDFSAITPDGVTHGSQEMAEFSRNLLANVEQWLALSFDILSLEERGDEVSADVRQHTIRMQRRNDGKVHRIENWVTQRETWVRTSQGWKMRRVDNMRDQKVLIDGQPRQ